MKVTIDRRSLLTAAAGVADAVSRRTTLPVLRCVRVTATADGRLTLEATDTESGVRLVVAGAAVDAPGVCLIAAAKLVEWLKAARDGPVTLVADPGKLVTLKAKGAKLEQPWHSVDEFPDPIPEVTARATVQTTAAAVAEAWGRVAFCRERKDTTKFVTSGVVLDIQGSTATLVASDSKRAGAAEIDGAAVEYAAGHAKPLGVNLPAGVGGLLATIAAGEEPVTLTVGANGVVLTTGRGAVYTRLIEGRCIPWREFMAASKVRGATKFAVDPGDLAAAVEQSAVTTDDVSKRVSAAFEPGRATLTSRGAGEGAGEVELDLPNYAGPEQTLAFDPDMILDFLKAAGGAGQIVVEVAKPEKPVFLSLADAPGWKYLFVPLFTPEAG